MPGFTDPWMEGLHLPADLVRGAWDADAPRNDGGYTVPARGHVHLETSGRKYPVKSVSYLMMFGLSAGKISAGGHGPWGYYAHRPGGSEHLLLWPEGFDYDYFKDLRRADGYW